MLFKSFFSVRTGFCFIMLALLVACSGQPKKSDPPRGKYDHIPPELRTGNEGRYAVDHDYHPVLLLNPATIENAIPKAETIKKAGNKNPYTVLGKTYHLMDSSKGYKEQGGASWYGLKFHGHKTSNGETYSIYAMSAAHKTLPIPSYVKVTNLANGKEVIVRVNDRGPFHVGRIIDLSYAAATKLDYIGYGTAQVEVEAIDLDTYQHPKRDMSAKPQANYSTQTNKATGHQVTQEKTKVAGNNFIQLAAYSQLTIGEDHLRRVNTQLNWPVNLVKGAGNMYRLRIGPIINADVQLAILRAAELGYAAAHKVP